MAIIALANLKGGVGKSTLAVNIVSVLAPKSVLVDADPQSTATAWGGAGHPRRRSAAVSFGATGPSGQVELRCSSRGCRSDAVWALRWNNPRLHAPGRRKVWLACEDHREHLEQFLGARAFHRETVPVGDLEPTDG